MSGVVIEQLHYHYPTKHALHDVSLEIKKGTITALVGPNGAGKSTLFRCIAGLSSPFSGQIWLDGIDVVANPRRCHRMMGYLPDFFGVYGALTVRQCLEYMAGAHHIPEADIDTAVKKAATRLQIEDRLDQKAQELSRGLTQRLGIAQALIHDPEFLLLDEPASGLDPEAREKLAELFLQLRQEGVTLFVSSHILAELDAYSTDMIIIEKGKIVEQANIQVESSRQRILKVSAVDQGQLSQVESILNKHEEVTEVHSKQGSMWFHFTGDRASQHKLLKELLKKADLYEFSEQKMNLQDHYMKRLQKGEKHESRA